MKNCKDIAYLVAKHGHNLFWGKPCDNEYLITVNCINLCMTYIALEMILGGEY